MHKLSAHFTQLVEFFLNWAREEVHWYFIHHDRTVNAICSKYAPKSPNVNQGNDFNVLVLVGLLCRVKELIEASHQSIGEHHAQAFREMYHPHHNYLASQLMNTGVNDVLAQILQTADVEIQNASLESRFGVRATF
jgi:hypothetical protein